MLLFCYIIVECESNTILHALYIEYNLIIFLIIHAIRLDDTFSADPIFGRDFDDPSTSQQ